MRRSYRFALAKHTLAEGVYNSNNYDRYMMCGLGSLNTLGTGALLLSEALGLVAALSAAGSGWASVAQAGEDIALRSSLSGHGSNLGGTADGGILSIG